MQVDLGGLDCSWPSQSAITEVSTPACSSRIAEVCRSTCGVIFFPASDGQAAAAVAACLVRRCSITSRLRRRPVRVGNSGSPGCPARSASQTRIAATVCVVSGVIRCLRPLPRQLTCAPTPSCDVAAVQAGQLGDAQAGLGAKQQQRVIATPGPGAAVRGGEERVDLGFGGERDQRAVAALGRDRQDALDRVGVLGMAQRAVAKQRADRGQAGVAGADLLRRSCSR